MEVTNHQRVGKVLEFLRQGLSEYVSEKMLQKHGNEWGKKFESFVPKHQKEKSCPNSSDAICGDVSCLLKVIRQDWNHSFKDNLSKFDQIVVNELIEFRNCWAHQSEFSLEDSCRAIDSALRLLKSISAPQVEDVTRQRQEVFRLLPQPLAGNELLTPISRREEAQARQRLEKLLKRIPFQNASLLNQALTHTSYKFENPNTGEDNEQLEFLGDAILSFLSGDYLYQHNPDLKEGSLTVLRSNLVDTSRFATFATEFDLGKWMRLGKGEESNGGRTKSSLLSNVFEAVIGAYYLDSGVEAVRALVHPLFEKVIDTLPAENQVSQGRDNAKGWLQEVVLNSEFPGNPNRKPPEYKTIRSGGTDNAPEYTSTVYVAGSEYGSGKGTSTKRAEKCAAEDALKKLKLI
jgi:ribonuclease-3